MTINIKTYNEIIGDMVRKILPNTPLNDINNGSVLFTLLEAIATSDFDNNSALLSLLELLSIDAIKNNDLDSRAADYGLTRRTAQKATGFVTVTDSTITKRSTGLYPIKPAPIAGTTTLYVNDASAWSATGSLYIGRGTQSFEGPIAYSSIVDYGSFCAINLSSALQKDHLISEVVIDQQGTIDRVIPAGTTIYIPANNLNPEVRYSVLRTMILAAGEDTLTNIPIICQTSGSLGNAGIGTIVRFTTAPFIGAAVSNTSALSDGVNIETDTELRERIKSYANTLARGTKDAILTAIIGIADSDDNKQVQSAVIKEPAAPTEPSIVYLDDGRGFQPSYTGQSVDVLLSSASGNEEFLQLANFPLPRPQVVNTVDGPFELVDGMRLHVYIDGIEESVEFTTSDFNNIAAATLPEIVIAINNDTSINFKCRLAENSSRLLIYPTNYDVETIQVVAIRDSDSADLWANNIIKFPTNRFSYINLYRNNELLKEKEIAASLNTLQFDEWGITTYDNLILSVDGTPIQDRLFSTSDFGGKAVLNATIDDWVIALNNKFAGITVTKSSNNSLKFSSNRIGSNSKIEIYSSGYLTPMFGSLPIYAEGYDSDFQLNRQTGNIRVTSGISTGDSIQAGSADTKGSIISDVVPTGTYPLIADVYGRPAEAAIVVDSDYVSPRTGIALSIGTGIAFSDMDANIMRIMSNSINTFAAIQPHDYLYIANRGDIDGTGDGTWADLKNCGLFKVIAVGGHTTASVDSYVEVQNIDIVEGSYTALASEDIQAFSASTYPQLWKGIDVTTPAAATISNIVNHIDTNLLNVRSSIWKASSIKNTSATEANGSIASPVSIGNAQAIFEPYGQRQEGNQSHVANRIMNQQGLSFFKRSIPSQTNTFLGKWTNTDSLIPIMANAAPNAITEPYSEVIKLFHSLPNLVSPNDQISFTKGANDLHYRSIKDIQANDYIGTQHNIPVTLFDHVSSDEVTVMKSLSFNPDDSIVMIMDKDPINKTVLIPMSRTGRIHSIFPPSNQSFSAYDHDNEPGTTFGSIPTWGTTSNGTDFKDYAIWFRAHNWYVSGGEGSGGGGFLIRAKEYGPDGEKIHFKLEHPLFPNTTSYIRHNNTPVLTDATLYFGSGDARAISIVDGLQFTVKSIGSCVYQYIFSGQIDLSSVVLGDVVGIASTSGVSTSNAGAFSIVAKTSNSINVYNPNGAATDTGTAEQTKIVTIADVVGTSAQHTIETIADVAGSLHQKYFTMDDDVGKVAFWYDIDNVGAAAPIVPGAYRYIKIANVATGDSADAVAAKTSLVMNLDIKFTSLAVANSIYVVNLFNGPVTDGNAGISGFTVSMTVAGVVDTTLDGKYFKIYDANGSVGVWYDLTGTTNEPFHGCSRAIRITNVSAGDSADTVASQTGNILFLDGAWSVTVSTNEITLVDSSVGGRAAPSAGTSGFTASTLVDGSSASPETINLISSFNIFPLTNNTVQNIVDLINTSPILIAVPTSTTSLIISKATREDTYTPAGAGDYSVSLAYGHNPNPTSGANSYVGLYDSNTSVKTFQNSNPNFLLKTNLLLQGASTAYNMGSALNSDTAEVGELFKLVPVTLTNVYHHFTQKALSQLPIIADVDIVNAYRSLQIKSKQLGSNGAVEIVGGRANSADFSIIGDSQNITSSGLTFTEVKIASAPIALNAGDYVEVYNTNTVKRQSKLTTINQIDVVDISNTAEYRINPHVSLTGAINITITDVSASHGRSGTGTVWRWTAETNTFTNVKVGDLIVPHDLPDGWAVGNTARATGDGNVSGMAVIAIGDNKEYVEIVNITGIAMTSTAIGAGTIDFVASPIVKWELLHDNTTTMYRIESLNFNNLYRLCRVSGASPKFWTCGVAVDDLMVIGGSTFKNDNRGKFRVLAVLEDYIVFQNTNGVEELNYLRPFNSSATPVTWTANTNIVTGPADAFTNVNIGDWVKKPNDDDSLYVQVLNVEATSITLGSNYLGTSSSSTGIAYDKVNGVNAGVLLDEVTDIQIYDCDSVQVNDQLFIDDIVNTDWFSMVNTGLFDIIQWGFSADYKPFIRINNTAAVSEYNRLMSVSPNSFYIIEGDDNATTMIKEVYHTAIDEFDSNKRVVYLLSAGMSNKISQTNGTKIASLGKLDFDSGITTGIDGYIYYTGLMRKVQKIIDGYEPDAINYPGRRAIGGIIELLPPLIRRVQLAILVTTNEGVNLNEITNDISSVIIKYINSLGVGQDVILSEIIVRVMGIKGVATVTFTQPAPSNTKIAIADTEKAFIEPNDISIA
jgi:uncharacterized phage protein gp47/JayE